jgi:hypothetical protein
LRKKANEIQELEIRKIEQNSNTAGKVINRRPNSEKKNPWKN